MGAVLSVRLQTDPPGVIHAPARPNAGIVIHVGASVHIACERGGRRYRGLSVHGDVDIIPPGVSSRWEMKERDTALIIGLPPELLRRAAEQADLPSKRLDIVNRFQIRDPQIEHLGWAIKAELEAGYPNGPLYLDSLGVALAIHVMNRHSSRSGPPSRIRGGFSGHKLKRVVAFIEDHTGDDLSLAAIAAVAGLSESHCKAAFRKSVGQPLHRYVVERRIERARALLSEGERSVSQVAAETGFAHASHLARHMKRLLGVSPSEAAENHPNVRDAYAPGETQSRKSNKGAA
jgi:AraC family transcriptional regulator